MFRRADARDRAGMDGLQRVGRVQLRHAAGIVDDQHRLFIAVRAQVLLQTGERVIHGRMEIGIDDRRGRAHIFAFAARPPDATGSPGSRRAAAADIPEGRFPRSAVRGSGLTTLLTSATTSACAPLVHQLTDLNAQIIFVERHDDVRRRRPGAHARPAIMLRQRPMDRGRVAPGISAWPSSSRPSP